MEKLMLLVREVVPDSYEAFKSKTDALCRRILLQHDPMALSYTITVRASPLLSVIPFRKDKIAVISIFTRYQATDIAKEDMPGMAGAYLVEEALPVSYDKNWRDGQPTPGVCLLTLFRKKAGIDHADFLSRWHNGHTPLSLKIHPLWHYNRNVVLKSLGGDTNPFDGVVEEHFRSPSELLNPFRFFGGPLSMAKNMLAVYRDVRSFLDYSTIETYYCSEYHIKSIEFSDPNR